MMLLETLNNTLIVKTLHQLGDFCPGGTIHSTISCGGCIGTKDGSIKIIFEEIAALLSVSFEIDPFCTKLSTGSRATAEKVTPSRYGAIIGSSNDLLKGRGDAEVAGAERE